MGKQNKLPEAAPSEEARVVDRVQLESQRSVPWGMPQESESMVYGVLEAAPDAIVITKDDGHIVLANHQVEVLFGYGQDELLGQPVEILLPERFRTVHEKHRGDYFSSPRKRPMGIGLDLTGRRKDGNEFPVEISLSPLMTEKGILVVTSIRDIRQWVRAEEAIRESEERMRRLIDSLPVCIAYVDSDQIYRLNNKTYEEWLGRERSEITGRHVKEVLGEKIYAMALERIQAALSGQTVTFEASMPIVGGGVRYVMATYAPDFGRRGDVQGYFVLVTDISERKRAEEAIHKREEQFRKIFDHSNDAIFLIDPAGDVILDANPKACSMLGYSRQELLSMGISAIHPDEMPELLAFTRSVLELGHGWTDELTCRTKIGRVLPAEMSASVVEIEGHSCIIALVRDTTERKEAEERIRREAARAEALARSAARLNAHLTLDAVLDAVCEETARALDAPAASVLLHDEANAELCLAATFGLPPEYGENYTPLPRAVYDRYAQQQGPLIILPDAQAAAELPSAELYARHNVRTIIGHSLIREGQLIGTLNLYTFDVPRIFDDHESALLKGLADQAAQAIENARLRQQAERAAVMEERGRLARELHDSVTQSLYSLTLLAEGWQRLARTGRLESVEDSLAELGEIAQQALKEMRLLVHELRPAALEREGLLGALHQRLAAVEKRAGVEARLVADEVVDLPASVEEGLYRIAQEALNNALKHAAATAVTVYVRADNGRVELEVADNGRGFDATIPGDERGMGLVSMRERVEKLGASLTVLSAPGEGTTVKISLETSDNS